MQHARDHLPQLVTGQLLGLDIGGVVEVSDCFPLPLKAATMSAEQTAEYQVDMMTRLREVHVDHNTVGWYQSTLSSAHVNDFLMDTQASYQADIRNAIVLTYDPQLSAQGAIALRAYRLSDALLALYKARRTVTLSVAAEAGLLSTNLLEELPVRLKVGALQRSLLLWLADHEEMADQFEAMDLSNADYIKKNLEQLLWCLGELQREQNTVQQWQRSAARLEAQQKSFLEKRRAENVVRRGKGEAPLSEEVHDLELENPSLFRKIPEPSRMETLLLTLRASAQATQVAQYAGKALTHQYATRAFEHA